VEASCDIIKRRSKWSHLSSSVNDLKNRVSVLGFLVPSTGKQLPCNSHWKGKKQWD
jgi:hypothetical protein